MNEEYRIPVPGEELDVDDDAGASDGSSDDASKTREDMRH